MASSDELYVGSEVFTPEQLPRLAYLALVVNACYCKLLAFPTTLSMLNLLLMLGSAAALSICDYSGDYYIVCKYTTNENL